jgi:D-alanyl-D-alanine-carboxypeptidase/D-alanyl-D-alanine-endopeptidase
MTQKIKATKDSLSRRTATKIIALCAFFIASAAPAVSQQPLSLADAALRGQDLYDQSSFTGMVLVVVRNREVMIKTYGETYPGSGRAPDANSLVRLCSISKVFTADLLMSLASEGKVGLTDPLQRYAPPGKIVPQAADGTQITLLDLATHTAGLPREVSSYPRKTPHFTFPNKAFRWTWLPDEKLNSTPGTVAAYSNIGFDLLGDALASANHITYAQLLHDHLLQPLAMWDTTLVPSNDQCARLLRGTSDEGPCTDTQPSGPSGGVYSTPTDMAKFLRYLLHTPGSPAQRTESLAVYLTPHQLRSIQGLSHAGNPTGIGLAWIQIGDPASPSMLMEKTGGGAGFSTYIALNPRTQTGIFLAATDGRREGRLELFHECNNILAALANVPPIPPKVHIVRAAGKRSKLKGQKPSVSRSPKRTTRPTKNTPRAGKKAAAPATRRPRRARHPALSR